MSDSMPYRKTPCEECPWRTDTPPGQFSAARYRALRATTGCPGREAWVTAPLFACHMTPVGRDMPCAGWLASVGYYSLHVRVLLSQGLLPRSVMTPGADWPELFTSYVAMEAQQAAREEG